MNITTTKNTFSNRNQKEEIKGKVIRDGAIARQILNKGGADVWLFDLKPDRDNYGKSVYIFRDDEKFQEVFESVLEDHKKRRGNREAEDLKKELDELQKKFELLTKMVKED